MADVITRFKLETTQFDSKLRDASKNIASLTNHLAMAGKDFDKFAKNNVEAARALGSVQSGATNLKDKLKDLVGAFNSAAKAYNALTQEQKQTDYGKALAASLQQLNARIRETKSELNSTGGILSDLKDKFVINLDATKLLSMGLKACQAALGVVKDAFMQSEGNIDEWGRTVEGAKGAYDVFLNALNTGNWNNFFTNLTNAIQGSRDLYDALDRLGSIKSNNEAAIALVQAEIQKLRVLKQQGKDVDDQIKDATQRLKALQGQAVTAGKYAGKKEITTTLRNQVDAYNTTGVNVSGATLTAAANRILKEGQSYVDGMANVVRMYESNSKYQTARVRNTGGGGVSGVQTTVSNEFDLSKLTQTQQKQYLIAKAITEGETQIQQGISLFAQAVNEGAQSTREEFRGNRYAMQGSGGGGGKGGTTPKEKELTIQQQIAKLEEEAYNASAERKAEIALAVQELDKELERQKKIRDEIHGIVQETKEAAMATGVSGVTQNGLSSLKSIQQAALGNAEIGSDQFNALSANIVDTTTLQTVLNEAIKNGIAIEPDTVEELWGQILSGENIPDEVWSELQDYINAKLQELGIEPIQIDFKTGNNVKQVNKAADSTEKSFTKAAGAVAQLGQAMQSVEDPTAKVAGTILLAVANAALAFANAAKGPFTNPWEYIAFAATGLATMITTITTIKQATKGGFAEGGIVPGNYMSGDQLNTASYGIQSGELVLNRAQQGVIASELERGGDGGPVRETYVRGDTIYLALTNYMNRTGKRIY